MTLPERTAFSCWISRIAPVFDVARQILLVESENGRILNETGESMPDGDPMDKVRRLEVLGVRSLVCGAVSREMQGLLSSRGITVIPFIAGDLPEVVRAWFEGRVHEAVFSMPGCCADGRRKSSKVRNRDRKGPVCDSRRTRGWIRWLCICPRFSTGNIRNRHPCSHKRCPACGGVMVRG